MNLFYQILAFFSYFFFHIYISLINFALLSPNKGHKFRGRQITHAKVAASSQVPKQRAQNSSLEIWSTHMIGLLAPHLKNLENSDKNPEFQLTLEKQELWDHCTTLPLNNSCLELRVAAPLDGTRALPSLSGTTTYLSHIHYLPSFQKFLSFQLSHKRIS